VKFTGFRPDQWRMTLVGLLLAFSTGCATTSKSVQHDLDGIRDELASQRKTNEEQRRTIDELRIRVEQLEGHRTAKATPAESDALASLPVFKVQPPAALSPFPHAPPVDTRIALREPGADGGAIDLNSIVAHNSPADTTFATATSFFNAGDWENSAAGFKKFIGRFPTHELVPQAMYMRGMSLSGLQHWSEAAAVFQEVLKAHGKSDAVAGTLVGLAHCEKKLGHTEKARSLLEMVVTQYPGTPEAAQATAALTDSGDRS
jgi:tol-pal system protein YbgF